MTTIVSIQGGRGSFHEQAAHLFYNYINTTNELKTFCCDTFEELFTSFNNDKSNALIIAIENTLSGGLLSNYSLLHKYKIPIKGEVFLRIEQNLMALKGQEIEDLTEVHSHYMAIAQTRDFFKGYPKMKLVESIDTAMSAQQIATSGIEHRGAIASKLAAQLFNLEILAPNIESNKENFTRFLILDNSITINPTEINKASLCFTIAHKSGCLSNALSIFAFYDLSLTKIQSLPIPGKQWQYFFYVDLKFNDYKRFQEAIVAVRPLLDELQIMGEYKSGEQH